MFARSLAAPGLRASLRAAPRASPMARVALQRRTMASTTGKKQLDNQVRRGFDEIVPFLKRLPVDVYPLVGMLSFVCVLGVFFSTKNLLTDKTLRLKPTTIEEE